jgi:hypothetical protein
LPVLSGRLAGFDAIIQPVHVINCNWINVLGNTPPVVLIVRISVGEVTIREALTARNYADVTKSNTGRPNSNRAGQIKSLQLPISGAKKHFVEQTPSFMGSIAITALRRSSSRRFT